MAYQPNRVRTGIFPFDPCHTSGAFSNQPFMQRRAFRISQNARRFRVHLRNHGQLTDTYGTALSNVGIGIGVPVLGTDGIPTGATVAAPAVVQASGTAVAAGTELISPWISPSTFQINAYQQYLLSITFTTATSSPVTYGSTGVAWQTLVASDVFVAAPSGIARAFNAALLHVWVEYEFADDQAPSILVVSNSCSISANTVVDNPGEQGVWHQVWAQSQRGFASNISFAGGYAANFTTTSRWNMYSTCAVAPEYDAVVYMALTSSDGVDQTLATVKTSFKNAVDIGKSLYPNARHIATNIPPRIAYTGAGATTSTLEYKRIQLNLWHHLLNGGVEQCLDIDGLLTNWADPGRLRAEYNSDDTHPNPRGHQRIGQEVSSMVGTRVAASNF